MGFGFRIRLTLSWFSALVCGSRRTQRNTYLKVAGFDHPMTDGGIEGHRTELFGLKSTSKKPPATLRNRWLFICQSPSLTSCPKGIFDIRLL